jgi:hypothetical protein
MAEDIIGYWRRFKSQSDGLNIHPDDRAWLKANKPSVLQQESLHSFSEYIASTRFNYEDSELHLSLLPVPFIGNLQKARIFVFLQNAGFDYRDYLVEEQENFRNISIKNIAQQADDEYPFFCLNPEFAWWSGFEWWEGKFRPITQKLMNDGMSYKGALQFLSKRVAVVELFPYHSTNNVALNKLGKWHEIPSVKKAQDFLSEAYQRTDVLKLVMRSHAHWNRADKFAEGKHFHLAPKTRGFTFNSNVTSDAKIAGAKIFQFLKET